MLQNLDLTTRSWNLACFRPNGWRLRPSVDHPSVHRPEFTLDAIVPGSAHTALRAANLIADWNVGTKSRDCEWLEHRHWEFYTSLHAIGLHEAYSRSRADSITADGFSSTPPSSANLKAASCVIYLI